MDRRRFRTGFPSGSIYKDITATKSAYSATQIPPWACRESSLKWLWRFGFVSGGFSGLDLSIGNKAPSAAWPRFMRENGTAIGAFSGSRWKITFFQKQNRSPSSTLVQSRCAQFRIFNAVIAPVPCVWNGCEYSLNTVEIVERCRGRKDDRVNYFETRSTQGRLRVSATTKFRVCEMVRGAAAGGCVSYPLSRSLPSSAGHNGIKITEEIQFPVGYVSRSRSSYSRGWSIVPEKLSGAEKSWRTDRNSRSIESRQHGEYVD